MNEKTRERIPEEAGGAAVTGTVETPSFCMDYLRFGKGGKPFVILPGLSVQSVLSAAEAIAGAFEPLTEDFTMYLFDRRKEIPEGYSVRDMAGDTAEAMVSLRIKGAALFGASQGGMIAMEIAARHPELVDKLILASSGARLTEEGSRILDEWIRLAKEGKAEELYLSFGENLYPAKVFEGFRKAFLSAAETVTPHELAKFVILAEAVPAFRAPSSLSAISCPALVLGSRDDRLFSEDSLAEIAEAIPSAALHMYDGYGHAVYDTAPDFVQQILSFTRRG